MTIRIPKVKNLLTARPEGMDYETYKRLRAEQNKMLHGWNETVMDGGKQFVRHYPGRLAGERPYTIFKNELFPTREALCDHYRKVFER